MFDLPQELIDRFIDEFHNSARELKTLSLVDKRWLHRARTHLFRNLTLMPQDLQAIHDNYDDVKRRASLEAAVNSAHYLTLGERKFLLSPLAENPQSTQSFLSSIANNLCNVRGLRLSSDIRVGVKGSSAHCYFRNRLGYGDDEAVSSYSEGIRYKQLAQWDDIDLPWGHCAGLHALPFRNLRFLHIQWSVFSWIPPSIIAGEPDILGGMDPDLWPGYQLSMLIRSNADTLDHLSIDEYPGFQFSKNGAASSSKDGDPLFDLLAKDAPNLRSLSLVGLQVTRPDSFLRVDKELLYPDGEKIPPVMPTGTDDSASPPPHSITRSLSLERLFLQGFDQSSYYKIENALINFHEPVLGSLNYLKYLALSSMPKDYDYMFILCEVQLLHQPLTHLTLDLDESTSNLNLKFSLFPNLERLQLIVHSANRTRSCFRRIVKSLSIDGFPLEETLPAVQVVKVLHIAFGIYSASSDMVKYYFSSTELDGMLKDMIYVSSETTEPIGITKVGMITVNKCLWTTWGVWHILKSSSDPTLTSQINIAYGADWTRDTTTSTKKEREGTCWTRLCTIGGDGQDMGDDRDEG
ncbi:hypothetical protein EV361DRAFT_871469 [Lentinula raphanica]|nr:hypothetical protein EV361DRAFT_871469 [Lentinula raphanica]